MLKRMLTRQRAVMACVAVFLAIQISVPALALFEPRPARFAWQMYSGSRTPANFAIVHIDGTTTGVSTSDYLVMPRLEMELLEWFPAHICDVEPDAVAVRIDHWQGDPEDVPCLR